MKRDSNLIVFFILTAICVILITASTIRDGWLLPLRTGIGFILAPLQSGVSSVGSALFSTVEERRALKQAMEENRKLQDTIDNLIAENSRLEQETFELQRLRELYKLDQEYEKYETVAARVIARDSAGWFDVFRINKGYNDGIKADMNVIGGGGLIGIVTDVGANYSTVRTIIDDSNRVSAMTMRSSDLCIVSGNFRTSEDGKLLISDFSAAADIKNGDKIVTSNVSSKYLPGILIGYASDIETDNSKLTISGKLIPAASFTSIQEVLVITQLKEQVEE